MTRLVELFAGEGGVASRYEHCIATTFTYDAQVFEEEVLDHYDVYDRFERVTVVIDAHQYVRELAKGRRLRDGEANRRYLIEPIHAPGCFHSKVWLLAGPKVATAVITSANLTRAGLGGQAEYATVLHATESNQVDLPAIQAVYEYLRLLCNRRQHDGEQRLNRHQDTLFQSVRAIAINCPMLQAVVDVPARHHFIHNLDVPLLEQIQAHCADEAFEPEEIILISRYTDAKPGIIEDLKSLFPGVSVTLITDAQATTLTEEWLPLVQDRTGNTKLHAGNFLVGDRIRPLHGKAFILRRKQAAWVYTGSANATQVALTRRAQAGNYEVLIGGRFGLSRKTILDHMVSGGLEQTITKREHLPQRIDSDDPEHHPGPPLERWIRAVRLDMDRVVLDIAGLTEKTVTLTFSQGGDPIHECFAERTEDHYISDTLPDSVLKTMGDRTTMVIADGEHDRTAPSLVLHQRDFQRRNLKRDIKAANTTFDLFADRFDDIFEQGITEHIQVFCQKIKIENAAGSTQRRGPITDDDALSIRGGETPSPSRHRPVPRSQHEQAMTLIDRFRKGLTDEGGPWTMAQRSQNGRVLRSVVHIIAYLIRRMDEHLRDIKPFEGVTDFSLMTWRNPDGSYKFGGISREEWRQARSHIRDCWTQLRWVSNHLIKQVPGHVSSKEFMFLGLLRDLTGLYERLNSLREDLPTMAIFQTENPKRPVYGKDDPLGDDQWSTTQYWLQAWIDHIRRLLTQAETLESH